MITLALYCQLPGPVKGYTLEYVAYFRKKEELTDMSQRVILEGRFSGWENRYMLVVAFSNEDKQIYYSEVITWEMHVIFRDYKKLFNKAYEMAKEKVWSPAWKMGGEKYRINCAFLQLDAARQVLMDDKWGQ